MTYFYNSIKILFTGCLVLLMSSQLLAQDPHFSQFYSAPTQVNPALGGVFAGEYRFVANYRTQNYAVLGDNSYKTIGASVDMRRRVNRDDYFSVGLAALQDQVGDSNFERVRGGLNASYLKHLGGGRYRSSDQYLVGGAQLGFGQWSYDHSNLWFTEQFDEATSSIDLSAANGETLDNMQSDLFVDFTAGLLYYNVLDKNNSFYIGGAMHHLNQPEIGFLNNTSAAITQRWVAQIGGELGVSRNVSLLPAAIVMGQGPSMMMMGGMNLRYSNRDWREVALRAGLWARMANQDESGMGMDAMVVSAILEVERWQFGLSYDITTSSLKDANNSRGAFELSLIYTHPSKERFKVVCPRF